MRLLVVIAHPDDAEFTSGGMVATRAAAGDEVTYLLLTDGDAGGWDHSVPRDAMPGIRREEQQRAAAVLGVKHVEFLGLPEGGIPDAGRELHVRLVRAIRRTRPDVLVTWSPEWNWARFHACHPDHLATGAAVLRAAYPDAGNPFALRDEVGDLEPWNPPEIWLFNSPQPNHYVDVTDVFETKLAAIGAHASQLPEPDEMPGWLRTRGGEAAVAAGFPEGRFVEAFQIVNNR